MSRLYYPPPERATLASGESNGIDAAEAGKKIAKMIPSEVITGYTALISLFMSLTSATGRKWAFGLAFLLGVVLTPAYLNQMADAKKPRRTQLIVATVAFVVWAYFTSGRQVIPDFYDSTAAVASLIIFTMISGAIPLRK